MVEAGILSVSAHCAGVIMAYFLSFVVIRLQVWAIDRSDDCERLRSLPDHLHNLCQPIPFKLQNFPGRDVQMRLQFKRTCPPCFHLCFYRSCRRPAVSIFTPQHVCHLAGGLPFGAGTRHNRPKQALKRSPGPVYKYP